MKINLNKVSNKGATVISHLENQDIRINCWIAGTISLKISICWKWHGISHPKFDCPMKVNSLSLLERLIVLGQPIQHHGRPYTLVLVALF